MRRDENRYQRELGSSSKERGATLEDDLRILLGDVCTQWGFCAARVDEILAASTPLTGDVFAVAVLAAEGWPEPEQDYAWRPKLSKLFAERYGIAVSAADYRPE